MINNVNYITQNKHFIQNMILKCITYNFSYGYAFGNEDNDDVRHPPGLPQKIDCRSSLVNILTKIIFQSSVMHSAVNFLQFEYGCFSPNVPGLLRGKIPKENDRGNIDMQRILDTLPGLKPCLAQAGVSFALTQFSDDEVFLLPTKEYEVFPPRWLFTEEPAKEALDKFIARLQKIEDHIQERNKKLISEGKIPYEVLRPSKIPYGIAI